MYWSRPLWVHLEWDPLHFLNLSDFFPHQVMEFFCHYYFKQFFYHCFFFPPSDIPTLQVLLCFILPWISLKLSSYFLGLLFCFVASHGYSFYLVFQLTDSVFCFIPVLLIPSSVFFISNILFFISFGFYSQFLCPFSWCCSSH